jgi:hypothetical protein
MTTASTVAGLDVKSYETTFRAKAVFHASVFAAAFVLLALRRPDAILMPQFYAEDGTFWYADAYNHSWHCLWMSEAGYLHTVPRLIALFSLLVPLAAAPLVMNLCAFFFQILPIHVFISSRFSSISIPLRLLSCLLYVAIPNSFEIHGNATNIQWHLTLVCCMVLLAEPAQRAWRIFDMVALILASVDSPLGIPLGALAAAVWWFRREDGAKWKLLALIPGTTIEVAYLLFATTRRAATNGANLTRLLSILGGQVFASSILGVRTFMQYYFAHVHFLLLAEIVAAGIGMAVILYALRFAPVELKLFVLFSFAVLAMALRHPLASMETLPNQWEMLRIPGVGNRYYFYPMLSFFACLIWMVLYAPSASRIPRYAALAILLWTPIGIYRDWEYKPFVDFHYPKYVAQFEQATPGTKVVIPTNPIWTTWTMELVKH